MAHTRSELESLTREWIALWSAPVNWQRFDQIHAGDFEDLSAAGRSPTKAGFAAGLRKLVEAFPDLVTRVEDLVVDEPRQRVAVRWSAAGTNQGAYLGIGPTQRATPITGIEIIEIEAGRVRRRWGEWDITAHHE
jgi:steroid delta-isomerase-like uncharacterized protein